MVELLCNLIAQKSISGHEHGAVELLASWAHTRKLFVDLWSNSDSELTNQFGPLTPHISLDGRPTIVIGLRGRGSGKNLMFNGHSDVVGVSDSSRWSCDPWSGVRRDGAVIGRGACDCKGPIVSALWALKSLSATFPDGLAGDVLLEVVPGEEDCVGLGTMTSVARGYRADGCIVLEPTRNRPRRASRSGIRFEVATIGEAVHGTVKWLGVDAIQLMRKVLDSLEEIERDRTDDPMDGLFDDYPILRPITVDKVESRSSQGTLCERCVAIGYLELLPGDKMEAAKARFQDELLKRCHGKGVAKNRVVIQFGEQYLGHCTPSSDPFCEVARRSAAASGVRIDGDLGAFNSGCEAGVRWSLHSTPTVVWGPGDLANAHAIDESIAIEEMAACAEIFARTAIEWSGREVET
ncbi:MAG: M20/M25/M40 family metallo-hydrolase [Planctomycetes bacterium]|nr:M20/M25/M40 family metallo-hydrolase [Planctomycetota bacterium]MBI3833922.1 M20/M25/M40 family metallo-hydrolase [Planctomycetota bacterium]